MSDLDPLTEAGLDAYIHGSLKRVCVECGRLVLELRDFRCPTCLSGGLPIPANERYMLLDPAGGGGYYTGDPEVAERHNRAIYDGRGRVIDRLAKEGT